MIQPPTLSKPSQTSPSRLRELPKQGPTQPAEEGLSSDRTAQVGINDPQKVSECAIVPTSECDKSSTFSETTGCGGASASPEGLENMSLSSEIEFSNEGRLELRKKSQSIGTEDKCEQIDKSPPKDGEK